MGIERVHINQYINKNMRLKGCILHGKCQPAGDLQLINKSIILSGKFSANYNYTCKEDLL